jgi:ABC-type amino acid transport substrate-binding protein
MKKIGAACLAMGWVLTALSMTGCQTASTAGRIPLLRVGVTPDYPPMIFQRGAAYAGVDANLALELGRALGRPVEFVLLRWDDQIPALLAGETDMIMSAMSITRARQLRVQFTQPYLRSGLVLVVRTADAERLDTIEKIRGEGARVGVIRDSAADLFMQQHAPSVSRVAVAQREDVGVLLGQERAIDAYLDDAHAAGWIVADHEASLVGIWKLLTDEQLAWAVRPADLELLTAANTILSQWKTDGTLDRIIRPWLPYLDKIEAVTGEK